MSQFKNSKRDDLNARLNMFDQPLLLANLTTAERDALTEPAVGSLIYNTTTSTVQVLTVLPNTWVNLN
jgi:hypothetical protein